ncbi:MAG: conjugal transfer protein TraX [Clostridia bacterium]|nr:conjugal transfer protein TraX [Clostridia bacterium]
MERAKGLSGNQLKLIAILAMTVDHLTWVFFPGTQKAWYVMALHVIGRLTAPIMWFFIAEGCRYTRHRGKYLARLFAFAVVSHFAYDFAFGIPFLPLSTGVFNQTSVMWSLALAASLIFLFSSDRIPQWGKMLLLALFCVLAFPSDWSSIAVMCPLFLYFHRDRFPKQAFDIVFWTFVYAAVYFLFLDKPYGALQMFTCLSIPLLKLYNGQRGNWKGMKWFFYLYYPAHLVAVGILRLVLHGEVPILFS